MRFSIDEFAKSIADESFCLSEFDDFEETLHVLRDIATHGEMHDAYQLACSKICFKPSLPKLDLPYREIVIRGLRILSDAELVLFFSSEASWRYLLGLISDAFEADFVNDTKVVFDSWGASLRS